MQIGIDPAIARQTKSPTTTIHAACPQVRLVLDTASPPSLSAIAKAERLSKQTVFRLKQDPQAALAALDAWGL
jgi:hypothetical protein